MANEPRSYREVMAKAIRQMRPDVEVVTANPDALDASVRRWAPDLVVCSEVTAAVRRSVPVWVELYPGYGSRSVASVHGRREEYDEIQLSDLLDLVERAEGLTR